LSAASRAIKLTANSGWVLVTATTTSDWDVVQRARAHRAGFVYWLDNGR
jgi:hypothetical protein